MEVRRLLIALIVWAGAASGCGYDAPDNLSGQYVGTIRPQIGNIQSSPTTLSKGEGGGGAVITGRVDFCDLDGDVVTLRTTTQNPKTGRTDVIGDQDVRGLAMPLTGSAAFCTSVNDIPDAAKEPIVARQVPFIGTLPFSLLVSTTLMGDRQFLVQVIDAQGPPSIAPGSNVGGVGASNVVIGRFSVHQ